MNEITTEKNYPIENRWIAKSFLVLIIPLIIILSIFILGLVAGEPDFFLLVYILIMPFNLLIVFLRKKNFHYALENRFLTLKQGIFSKQERHIPYEVIQHTYIQQDLLDRILGLTSLTIENASSGSGSQNIAINSSRKRSELIGFSGNKVSIPGLTKQNAESLKLIVLQKMKENPMGNNQSGL